MTGKSVAEKARVKAGTRFALLEDAAPGVVDSLGLPADVRWVDDPAEADAILVFVNSRAELDSRMLPAVEALRPGVALWVFFRKGSRAAGLDMNRDDVWAIAEDAGLRPLGLLGVDEVWSVFRLRRATAGR